MDYNTAEMKVEDIRRVLIDEYGLEEKLVINTKGKAALVNMLNGAINEVSGVDEVNFGSEESSGDFEAVDDKLIESNEEIAIPLITDVGWHDYVMSKFSEDEISYGNPTVDGMRRVVEDLISPIKYIQTEVKQLPDLANERRATVVVHIGLDNGTEFSGAADAYYGNCNKEYRNYPVSVAETRAEGRALKRALRLKKVHAAEEIGVTSEEPENVEEGLITETQLRFLDIMCNSNRLNIDIKKLAEYHKMTTDIKKLTHKEAVYLNERLSNYQSKAEEIPEGILGYQGDWQS